MTEISLFEAMYSARALRRLKTDAVPEALITQILDAAIRAPSAGNAQNWIFLVVRDPAQRGRLGAVYRKAADEVAEIYAARGRPAHMTEEEYARMMSAGRYLWDHIGEAPVLLLPCLRKRDMPPREALRRRRCFALQDPPCLSGADPRREHLSGDPEHHPRLPRPWPRHPDHHQPHPLRRRRPRDPRPAGRCVQLRADADRLSQGQIRPPVPPDRRRGYVR